MTAGLNLIAGHADQFAAAGNVEGGSSVGRENGGVTPGGNYGLVPGAWGATAWDSSCRD